MGLHLGVIHAHDELPLTPRGRGLLIRRMRATDAEAGLWAGRWLGPRVPGVTGVTGVTFCLFLTPKKMPWCLCRVQKSHQRNQRRRERAAGEGGGEKYPECHMGHVWDVSAEISNHIKI